MAYHVTETAIRGVLLLEPQVFADARGFFLESFNQRDFDAVVGPGHTFVQDNHSRSCRGVLRGLHFQASQPQGKLVRVTSGRVWDVAVDIYPRSPTFRRWVGVELAAERPQLLWIPPGLAHGFLVLSETADFLYKTTAYYDPAGERCIRLDDPTLASNWPDPGTALRLSEKDRAGLNLAAALA